MSDKFTKLLPNLKNIYYYLLLIFIIILNLDSALVYDSNTSISDLLYISMLVLGCILFKSALLVQSAEQRDNLVKINERIKINEIKNFFLQHLYMHICTHTYTHTQDHTWT